MSRNNNRNNTQRKKANNTNKPLANKVEAKAEDIKQDLKETAAEIKEVPQTTKDNAQEVAKDIKSNTKITQNNASKVVKYAKTDTGKLAGEVTETTSKVENTVKSEKTQPKQLGSDDMSNKNQEKNNSKLDASKPDVNKAQAQKPANDAPPSPKKTTTQTASAEKKGGSLVTTLALLTGIAGTGIGVYNYDQVRKLNAIDQTATISQQLKSFENKIAELGNQNNDELTNQLKAQLDKLSKSVQANETKANKRLSAVEQTQNGLTKTLQGDMKETLDKRLQDVNSLLSKVDQIELTQQSISQNLNQAVAAGEAVTAEGMAKQEIGYLLRMADYKVQSEGDAAGAAGLLEIAERKMMLLNQGKSDRMVETIRQKYIQLQGVKPVDSNALISSLKKMSGIVPNLMPKPNDSKPVKVAKTTTEEAGSLLTQVGDILASGIEYTPNDPSKIDISAETILIEKRLMQADIRTAELAVRSQNGVLLAETLNSIRTNLDKYFADDDTAKAIKSTLATIEKQKLETVLPDLGSLVKQYEDR